MVILFTIALLSISLSCNAIPTNSTNAETIFTKGLSLANEGKISEALEAFNKAIELKPDYADAWYNKGVALAALGFHEKALEAYEKAIEINPDDDGAWYNIGVALEALGFYEKAIEAYDKVIKINPDDAEAWYSLGVAYSNLNRLDKALSLFNTAIKLKPNFAKAWYNKGLILRQKNNFHESLKALDNATKFDPLFSEAWYSKGAVLIGLKRLDEAFQACNKAIEIESNVFEPWFNRAFIYALKGEKRKANIDLQKAIELNPALKSTKQYKDLVHFLSMDIDSVDTSSSRKKKKPWLNFMSPADYIAILIIDYLLIGIGFVLKDYSQPIINRPHYTRQPGLLFPAMTVFIWPIPNSFRLWYELKYDRAYFNVFINKPLLLVSFVMWTVLAFVILEKYTSLLILKSIFAVPLTLIFHIIARKIFGY